MSTVVTFGEIMLRLSTPGFQRFTQAQSFELPGRGSLEWTEFFKSLSRMGRNQKKQLEVLDLIHDAQDEIFPPRLTIRAPAWAPAPDADVELFGPLVGMMRARLRKDGELREKLVRQAMQRKAATNEHKLFVLRTLALLLTFAALNSAPG